MSDTIIHDRRAESRGTPDRRSSEGSGLRSGAFDALADLDLEEK